MGAAGLLGLQRSVGNQAVERLLRARSLEARPTVSATDDRSGRDADRVAARVTVAPPSPLAPAVLRESTGGPATVDGGAEPEAHTVVLRSTQPATPSVDRPLVQRQIAGDLQDLTLFGLQQRVPGLKYSEFRQLQRDQALYRTVEELQAALVKLRNPQAEQPPRVETPALEPRASGEKVGENVVRVRPWLATVSYQSDALTETAADLDVGLVEREVASIWGKVGVTLQYQPVAKLQVALSKLPQAYANDQEFTDELNAAIRPTINEAVALDERESATGIQAVFIPTNDRWGFTHHPGRASGFDAPVTVVATKTAGVGANRAAGEARITPEAPGDFVPLDVILDTAHEIGHALGLEHAERPDEVHLLMHKALYHTIGNAAKMSSERAQELMQAKAKHPGIVGLYKKKGSIGNTPGEIWTMMHGPELTQEQITSVLDNVKSKAYLAGH
jgi:hypothetical protein